MRLQLLMPGNNKMIALAGYLGQQILNLCAHCYRFSKLGKEVFYWIVIAPWKGKRLRWQNTLEQMVFFGFNSIPIVTVICFFVGLILAMQASYQLKRFGASIYVADLVAVTVTREMGPLITAIIIAGRSGSAIAAEIGTMKVSEEIDALHTMGFNPIQFLVVPRILALFIMLPCLTLIADLVGILGGFFIAIYNLNISAIRYLNETISALVLKDLVAGLVKTLFFAIIIALIGCYQGLQVEGGAEGVGKATTNSVVASIFFIIMADLICTAFFYSTF
jgi:phospholipid/cholesterol/gamma-HCH transport system permease protein